MSIESLPLEITDAAVRGALRAVPRELFVPKNLRGHARRDTPLPIGHGQTISQPSLVAFMTQLLRLGPRSRVLEVGTGSGYQAAILGEIAAEVYTIERLAVLADLARERLERLDYTHVHVRHADGTRGWSEAAPFDGILLAAAGRAIPALLCDQLEIGGRLVAPVADDEDEQWLIVLEKTVTGALRQTRLWPVRFVPLLADVA